MHRLGSVLAASALVAVALSGCRHAPRAPVHAGVTMAAATFTTASGPVRTGTLQVATTPAQRARGLMGRSTLTPDAGMVFVFDEKTDEPFWMKDTLIPLSIAFWGDDGRVTDILDMQPCDADPCPTYTPRTPYTRALEMNLGWFDRQGIRIGDPVDLVLAGV